MTAGMEVAGSGRIPLASSEPVRRPVPSRCSRECASAGCDRRDNLLSNRFDRGIPRSRKNAAKKRDRVPEELAEQADSRREGRAECWLLRTKTGRAAANGSKAAT